MEKGQSSSFFMNVDGVPGKEVTDVEILANDSIYIFVKPNPSNLTAYVDKTLPICAGTTLNNIASSDSYIKLNNSCRFRRSNCNIPSCIK